jgi:hypothetical protein
VFGLEGFLGWLIGIAVAMAVGAIIWWLMERGWFP